MAALTQTILQISAADQAQLWQQSQSFSQPPTRWHAYLNRLCLAAILPWLQEASGVTAQPWPHPQALASLWAFVNGTALTVNGFRLVLLPTEAIDHDELRVPQEWVDLPEWVADYYLAAQVEPDGGQVTIWGYTTHARIKTTGTYNPDDRTYSVAGDDLIADLAVLWVSRQLGQVEPLRQEIAPLPLLPLAQAENLITRLSQESVLTPRLAVPFPLWGALVSHGGWRQRLYERRQGLPDARSLLEWLRSGIPELARRWGWERLEWQAGLAAARSDATQTPSALLARSLVIAGQPYELRLLAQESDPAIVWEFELRSAVPGGLIPGGVCLRLLTEDLQAFEGNEVTADQAVEQLSIRVALEPGEGIVWETDPRPEGYDREILRA